MKNQELSPRGKEVLKALLESKGRFFNVVFKKKSGELRTMQARLGVQKFSKGGLHTTAHIPKYITVYENGTQPKNVNLNTVLETTVNGKKTKWSA